MIIQRKSFVSYFLSLSILTLVILLGTINVTAQIPQTNCPQLCSGGQNIFGPNTKIIRSGDCYYKVTYWYQYCPTATPPFNQVTYYFDQLEKIRVYDCEGNDLCPGNPDIATVVRDARQSLWLQMGSDNIPNLNYARIMHPRCWQNPPLIPNEWKGCNNNECCYIEGNTTGNPPPQTVISTGNSVCPPGCVPVCQ